VTLFLLPGLIFIFLIGWSMYWIGDQKRTGKTKRKAPPKKDNVTLMPIILEETPEIANG